MYKDKPRVGIEHTINSHGSEEFRYHVLWGNNKKNEFYNLEMVTVAVC